jgi:glycosyltransferase involved in cell wall biosynthesis
VIRTDVTLVIPARNAGRTLRVCLDAVGVIRATGALRDVIVVDDGSTDETAKIAAEYGATVLTGAGDGPGSARNLGWRHAQTDWVWFIDSDCVPEPEALSRLLPHLADPAVAGVGGSYGNMRPDSWLACLIHEEIVERHLGMPYEVNFLATFNVLYRRSILEESGGFDESLKLAQDAELAYRIIKAGHRLRFASSSRVGHFHPTRFGRYLWTQARQGYYRIQLYRRHPDKLGGDAYSNWIDHIQPPLAAGICGLLPFLWLGPVSWMLAGMWTGLLLCQLPMTIRLATRLGLMTSSLTFAGMSLPRAFARAAGLSVGLLYPTAAGARSASAQVSIRDVHPAADPTRDHGDTLHATVIVCVHNRPRKILDCLESLRRMSSENWDLVIVDDGSTDETPEVLQTYRMEHPSRAITIVRKETNAGVSSARNAGIAAARGEIVLFTDSDCTVDPDWVAAHRRAFADGAVAATAGLVMDAPPRNYAELTKMGMSRIGTRLLQNRRLVGSNMGFRRAVLQAFLFDEALTYRCDEDDLAHRLVQRGHKLEYVPAAKVFHDHPITLAGYLLLCWRQGVGSACYWRKHGRLVGRDILFTLIALWSLAGSLYWPWLRYVAGSALVMQVAALLTNEVLLKRKSVTTALAVLPLALCGNLVKTTSVCLCRPRWPWLSAWSMATSHKREHQADEPSTGA